MAGQSCPVEIDGDLCGRPSQPGAPNVPGKSAPPCPGHYVHQRKGVPYRKLRTARGAGAMVQFRCPIDLKTAAQVAAEREGLDEAEWWRRAGTTRLGLKLGTVKR